MLLGSISNSIKVLYRVVNNIIRSKHIMENIKLKYYFLTIYSDLEHNISILLFSTKMCFLVTILFTTEFYAHIDSFL